MSGESPDFGLRREFYTFAPETLAAELPAFELLRELGGSDMPNGTDAWDDLDAGNDDSLEHLGDVEPTVEIGIEGHRQHRGRIRIGLGHPRSIHLRRQTDARDAVANIVCRFVDVARKVEFDADVGELLR